MSRQPWDTEEVPEDAEIDFSSLTGIGREISRRSRMLDRALAYLRRVTEEAAEAEADYRKAKALAWARAPKEYLADHRRDWVSAEVADAGYRRDLGRDMRKAAEEVVRARRAQLSAVQSVLSAHKAEAEFDRTGAR